MMSIQQVPRPLDAVEEWMVRMNLEYVPTEGLPAVVTRLRAQGYLRVAAAVEERWQKR